MNKIILLLVCVLMVGFIIVSIIIWSISFEKEEMCVKSYTEWCITYSNACKIAAQEDWNFTADECEWVGECVCEISPMCVNIENKEYSYKCLEYSNKTEIRF